jgi:hypothetical protein
MPADEKMFCMSMQRCTACEMGSQEVASAISADSSPAMSTAHPGNDHLEWVFSRRRGP